jgi:hypothetical protein
MGEAAQDLKRPYPATTDRVKDVMFDMLGFDLVLF